MTSMTEPVDRSRTRGLMPPWQKGHVANPAGRPLGARSKLGEKFLVALHADFVEHGVGVIETVRREDPTQYLRIVAAVLPKELEIRHDPLRSLSDEELAELSSALKALKIVDVS